MSADPVVARSPALPVDTAALWLAALALLAYATVSGAVFGVVTPSSGQLSAHLHAGALGWLALSVLGASVALFPGRREDAAPSWSTWAAIAGVVVFVVTAATADATAEAVGGTLAVAGLLSVVARLSWSGHRWTVPRLAAAGALAALVVGSLVGAASAAGTAGGAGTLAARLASAHSALLVVPFVVLAVMAVVEWAAPELAADSSEGTLATVQVGLVVLAAVALFAGVLARNLALVEANVPLLIGGAVVFLVRVGPALFSSGWSRAPRLWLGLSAVALAVDIGLFSHVLVEVARHRYASIDLVPAWLLFAVDHVTFVALSAGALFGAVSAAAPGELAAWSDRPAAAGLALGLLGAVLAIGSSSSSGEELSLTVLGAALLLAGGAAVGRVALLLRAPAGGAPAR